MLGRHVCLMFLFTHHVMAWIDGANLPSDGMFRFDICIGDKVVRLFVSDLGTYGDPIAKIIFYDLTTYLRRFQRESEIYGEEICAENNQRVFDYGVPSDDTPDF